MSVAPRNGFVFRLQKAFIIRGLAGRRGVCGPIQRLVETVEIGFAGWP